MIGQYGKCGWNAYVAIDWSYASNIQGLIRSKVAGTSFSLEDYLYTFHFSRKKSHASYSIVLIFQKGMFHFIVTL